MRCAGFNVILLAIVSGGCAGPQSPRFDPSPIREILATQAEAWNRGDTRAFMEPYWHSKQLTFSAQGQITKGWERTLARYLERYPSREDMGRLAFSNLEITALGDDVAVVVGSWHLERAEPTGGVFTLVFHRSSEGWAIKFDHTSVSSPARH